jgi:cellulose synthase/poly-beta-1,6-N-acetylglucosamine synthase-like glycosyltransferase
MGTAFLIVWLGVFVVSLLGIALVFALYPLFLLLAVVLRGAPPSEKSPPSEEHPFLSIVIVVRNAEERIEAKVRNALELDYPTDRYEIIVYSDGSEDGTEQIVRGFDDPRVKLDASADHRGKARGLNEAVKKACGEILVFSDGDAQLERGAVRELIKHYRDPDIGGVCGRRVVRQAEGMAARGQSSYVDFDSLIKRLETAVGSISSNDGKLYSVRRELFRPLEPGTSDDLDCCLNIVEQGRRFVFEPNARAFVPLPSKDLPEELRRRRRIVCGSLRSIRSHIGLFNLRRHGSYGIQLGINKVLRRLLPLNLLLVLVSTLALWNLHPAFPVFAGLQGICYAGAALYPVFPRTIKSSGFISFLPETAYYFCVGNLGTVLGLVDYLFGRSYAVWTPSQKGGMPA